MKRINPGNHSKKTIISAEEWWTKLAMELCQKAERAGVMDFRIWKVGDKWAFQIIPEGEE